MGPPPWSQGDSYRPTYRDRGPPSPPADAAIAMFHFQGYAGDHNRRSQGRPRDHRVNPRHDFSFRAGSRISERPLLRKRHDQFEEQVLGDHGLQDKFRDLDNLTDSDEAEMEDSEGEEEPEPKRFKIAEDDNKMGESPKWSNPDPYTALPAPNETTGKKIDVVKMIRKARQDLQKDKANTGANVEDFISLSMNDQDDSVRDDPAIPTGPAIFRQQMRQQTQFSSNMAESTHREYSKLDKEVFAALLTEHDNHTLGKRKRDTPSAGRIIRVRGEDAHYSDGDVLDKWRASDQTNSTPWLRSAKEESAGIALHKEILDFYEWVKPREYEFAVRGDCIARLSTTLKRFHPGELRAFGSYGAGLFLPTGDMDLVFLETPFLARLRRGEKGLSAPLSKFLFRQWVSFIRNANIAKPGSIVPIASAKVPIIKFIDRVSGLKIDLSFNNDTGLVANETFQKWKTIYPAMPILVSVIKQFLMIRGLNDVSTGGLGGFSTICLVTSIIQHLPNSGGPQNLGEVLLQFFNLYGNHLDRDAVAIRLDPPGYIDKRTYAPQLYSNDKKGRLTIIDPHRPDNNISGGTSQIKLIAAVFSEKHDIIQDLLSNYEKHAGNVSFLEPLTGGNFEAYTTQRNALYSLHLGQPGLVAPQIVPDLENTASSPPTIPVARAGWVSRSFEGDDNNLDEDGVDQSEDVSSTDSAMNGRPFNKAQRRAHRFKKLRPDLADRVADSLTVSQAQKLGGYSSWSEMNQDLNRKTDKPAMSGLQPAQKRALRLKALRPDIADQVGDRVNVLKAMKIGGYKTKEAMKRDLNRRETGRT